jgi:hypothetical protein
MLCSQQEDLGQALCKCNSEKGHQPDIKGGDYDLGTRLNENLSASRTVRNMRRNKGKTCRNTYHVWRSLEEGFVVWPPPRRFKVHPHTFC